MKKEDPIVWAGLGIGVFVLSNLLVDAPSLDFGQKLQFGEVFGYPFKYLMVASAGLIAYAVYVWRKPQKPN